MASIGDAAVFTDTKKTASVLIHLRSVGEAPAFRNNKFRVNGEKRILDIEKFIHKKLSSGESTTSEVHSSDLPSSHRSSSTSFTTNNLSRALYLYCGSGFSPTGDQLLQDLFDSFQVGGELTIHYSFTEAWG